MIYTNTFESMAQTTSRSTCSSDSGGSPGGSPGRGGGSTSTPRTYMCKVCGNLFKSGQSLGGHMNVHRKDQRSGSSTPPSASQEAQESATAVVYKGVRHRKEQHKWVAEIRPPRATRTWWLGTYNSPEEAAYAYDVAITYFGSESSLNFPGHRIYEQIPRISEDLQRQDYAQELRKVVKKFGKLAMEAGNTGSTSTGPELLGWDDFEQHPAGSSSSGPADPYYPFDFETFPMNPMQPSDFTELDNCYDEQGFHDDWPSFQDPKNY